MERTIKFRAWDKNADRMVPWEELKDNVMPGHLFDPDERFTAMQFTGLTDSNGKKIYEGDVVRVEDKTSGYPFEIGEVVYRNEIDPSYAWGWRINWIGGGKIPQALHVIIGAEKIEIIGNIYENPELLNT